MIQKMVHFSFENKFFLCSWIFVRGHGKFFAQVNCCMLVKNSENILLYFAGTVKEFRSMMVMHGNDVNSVHLYVLLSYILEIHLTYTRLT